MILILLSILAIVIANLYFLYKQIKKIEKENKNLSYCYFNFDGQELRIPVPYNYEIPNVGDIATIRVRCKDEIDEMNNNEMRLKINKIIKVDSFDNSFSPIPEEDTDFYISRIINI